MAVKAKFFLGCVFPHGFHGVTAALGTSVFVLPQLSVFKDVQWSKWPMAV
jgi:hypothetical protein